MLEKDLLGHKRYKLYKKKNETDLITIKNSLFQRNLRKSKGKPPIGRKYFEKHDKRLVSRTYISLISVNATVGKTNNTIKKINKDFHAL